MSVDKLFKSDSHRTCRVRVSWPVVVLSAKGATVGETVDISIQGAFIRCNPPLESKERPRLFIMAPNHPPIDVPSEVAWSNLYGSEEDSMPCGIGVRFKKISASDHQFLRNVISMHFEKKLNIKRK